MTSEINREIEEKIGRVTRLLAEEKLGGLLIGAQHNVAWLTGGGTNGIDLSREAGAGALFVRRDGRRFVVANNIEMPRLLAEAVHNQGYEPIEFSWVEEKTDPSCVARHVRPLLQDTSAEFGSDLPVSGGGGGRVVEGEVARLRYQLTDSELERYRALGRDAGEALGEVMRALAPGETEIEIARRANDAVAARGAHAVVTLVAADDRLARFRHPVPTLRAWGDVVMVVVCARRAGLIVSLSRIACAGAMPDDLRHRTEAAARVNARLFAATRPGASGRELFEIVARAYAAEGFAGEEQLHHQGGAAGYRTRDWVAHPQCTEVVQARQGFAWNPSITGTKVEETCIAFADRVEIITATPDWPSLSIDIDGRDYLLPHVLSL